MSKAPNYDKFVTRILDIAKRADTDDEIAEFRYGDLPGLSDGTVFPLCYVTTSRQPEVYRETFASEGDVDKLPIEKRELEFWAVILSNNSIPEEAQSELYKISYKMEQAFAENVQLKDENGEDPLCATTRVLVQGRMEQLRGKTLEGLTIRIRPILFVSS